MKPAFLLLFLLVTLPTSARTATQPDAAAPDATVSQPPSADLIEARQRTLQSLAPSTALTSRPSSRRAPGGLFGFYSRYVSSQDGAPCGFTPSCSAFTQQAVERYGLVRGVLLGIDRLLRDNGAPHGTRHPHSGKVQDPVTDYRQAVQGGTP